MKTIFLLAIAGLGIISCTGIKKEYTVAPKSKTETNGTAKFTQKGDIVKLNLKVNNLTPGLHAVHLHEFGDCSSADAMSAGGHWNPEKTHHGKWETEHFHMGDIGNIKANQEGTAVIEFATDKWCLGCDDPSKNIIGKSIIIHASEDDFHTQPTGNAGGRVGCVEIK